MSKYLTYGNCVRGDPMRSDDPASLQIRTEILDGVTVQRNGKAEIVM